MASILETARGYRAEVYVLGRRDSASFRTRREAVAWAAAREVDLRAAGAAGERATLRQVMERYRDEVSPTKRGARNEHLRIEAMLRMDTLPLGLPLARLTTADFLAWRTARMRSIRPGSFLREVGILTAVFSHARRGWGWMGENPLRDLPKPAVPDHRERVITRAEIRAMLRALPIPENAPESP